MRYWYIILPLIGEVCAEYLSVTRGYQFFDAEGELGERLVRIGKFHAIWTLAS